MGLVQADHTRGVFSTSASKDCRKHDPVEAYSHARKFEAARADRAASLACDRISLAQPRIKG